MRRSARYGRAGVHRFGVLLAISVLISGDLAVAAPQSGPQSAPVSAAQHGSTTLHNPDIPNASGSAASPTITGPGSVGGAVAAGATKRPAGGGITRVNGSRVNMGILDAGWADIAGVGFGDTPGVVSVLRPYRRHAGAAAGLPPSTLLVLQIASWSDTHIRVQVAQPEPDGLRRLAVPTAGLFDMIPNLILDVAPATPDGDVHYQASPFSVGVGKPIRLNGANNPP